MISFGIIVYIAKGIQIFFFTIKYTFFASSPYMFYDIAQPLCSLDMMIEFNSKETFKNRPYAPYNIT